LKSLLNKKLFYQTSAFLISFIVYVLTLAPTVSFIDCGELATACITLGIAHPTGYPLFTLIGKIFTFIPFVDSEIYKLNLMAAVLCSAALVVFFNIMVFLFKENNFNDSSYKNDLKSLKSSNEIIYALSLSTTMILGFSATFWATANAIEVYSLHILFLMLNIYLFLKACSYSLSNKAGNMMREKYWILFSFVLGLSFTNHLSTIFLSIGFLYLFFSVNGLNKNSFKLILLLAIPFLMGYSVYIYLFIRADNPVISWGYPHNFENFWRHFTGKQFSVWMFSSFENAGKQFSHFTKIFPKEYFYIPVVLAIPGLIELFKRSKRIFYFTILLFGFCILYAINYDIYDIDSYFLLAFIVAAIWIGFGILFIVKKFKVNAKQVAFGSLLLCLLPLYNNYNEVDESKNYFVKDYTMNVFKSAPENAIIFSIQWDFWVSASMYYQFIENIRPDIAVIDKELMRKTWYMEYLKNHYPDIYENSKFEFETYLTELRKFEKNSSGYTNPITEADRQEALRISQTFLNLLNSLVDKNYGTRSFLTTYEIEQGQNERFGNDYTRIPRGLLFEYSKEKDFQDYPFPDMQYEITDRTGYHYNFIMNAYYSSYLSNANYLMNYAKFDDAEILINKAIQIRPDVQDAHRLLAKLNQLRAIPQN
jgi:hypothetical protein